MDCEQVPESLGVMNCSRYPLLIKSLAMNRCVYTFMKNILAILGISYDFFTTRFIDTQSPFPVIDSN